MRKQIYVAGKISSVYWKKYLKRINLFNNKEKELRALGYRVLNPISLYEQGKSWGWYMARISKLLVDDRPICYFLRNWKRSRGARLEMEIAKYLNLKIIIEK